MKKHQTALGIGMTLLGGCFWGLCGVCGQLLFQNCGVTSAWLVPYRLTLAGAILMIYYLIRDWRLVFSVWKSRRDAIDLLLYTVFGLTMCQYSYFATIELSNAATATVLQYSAPAMLLILMCILERRRPAGIELAGVLCATAGVFLLATHGNFRSLAISGATLAMGMVAAMAVVSYNLLPRRLMKRFPTTLLLGWGMLLGGLALMPVFRPWQYHVTINTQVILAMAAIILLGTVASFSLYMTGMKYIGPTKASLYSCIEPVAAAILCMGFLHVPFEPIDLAGFALVLATTFILAIPDLRQARKENHAHTAEQ